MLRLLTFVAVLIATAHRTRDRLGAYEPTP